LVSDARWTANTRSERTGLKHTELNFEPVLHEAWAGGFTTKSDFARANADEIACAASSGLLTVQDTRDTFGRSWRITPAGLALLWQLRSLA
jgi:hypothetical protein